LKLIKEFLTKEKQHYNKKSEKINEREPQRELSLFSSGQ
jgi:hypothetical protein